MHDQRIDPITDWLAREAPAIVDPAVVVEKLAERIAAAGLGISRLTLHIRTIHPEILAVTILWQRGKGAEIIRRLHGVERDAGYTSSPIFWIHGGMERLRRHLEDPHVAMDFPILQDLKAEGATDYLALRMPFSDGTGNSVTWATDRPGGFSAEDFSFIDTLLPYLALAMEVRVAHFIAQTLLSVYLGSDVAMRVLRGEIKRGIGQTIEAAVLFSDMRSFTQHSEHLPPDRMITLLDDYFQAVIEPVEDYDGQVLKLMGDGLLAIFPVHAGGAHPACLAALAAAKSALANVAEVNRKHADDPSEPRLRIGITLHVGQVVYGNIGSPHRLDFTVIGPSVNLVSRLQGLCREYERSVLFSSAFAEASRIPAVSIGTHSLRGLAAQQEVFGLPPHEDPSQEL